MSDPADDKAGPAPKPEDLQDGSANLAVLLIDDRPLFGESLATAMHACAPDLVVTHRRSADALHAFPEAVAGGDVVLVSLGRSGRIVGTVGALLEALSRGQQRPPVVILAETVTPRLVERVQRFGVRGVLPRTASVGTVIDALRRVHGGATILPGR